MYLELGIDCVTAATFKFLNWIYFQMEAYVQTIPTCQLGEAPHWNADKEELYYVDVNGQSVHRLVPGTGEHTQATINSEEGDGVNIIIPVEGQPNNYVVSIGRTLQLMEWDGLSPEPTSLTNMYSVEPDRPRNSFNDGKCDVSGRLWAGTRSDLALPVANLYRVTDTGIQTVQTGATISNGMAWSGDSAHMYYIDTILRRVDVFDFDNVEGAISNRRSVYNFNLVGERGFPDGMSIDANGNLWVACFGASQIIQVDPSTGQKVSSIEMPTKDVTSIAFGGPGLDVMYVTSGIYGLTPGERAQQPSAGSLFQITNLGVKGMRAGNNFKAT